MRPVGAVREPVRTPHAYGGASAVLGKPQVEHLALETRTAAVGRLGEPVRPWRFLRECHLACLPK
ncbi:MAG: hypothetical protein HC773_29915 [Scytonema sp. CRU_2_7]|nr:hypothetical protein [Scytonema sp. CRU_2_7]